MERDPKGEVRVAVGVWDKVGGVVKVAVWAAWEVLWQGGRPVSAFVPIAGIENLISGVNHVPGNTARNAAQL